LRRQPVGWFRSARHAMRVADRWFSTRCRQLNNKFRREVFLVRLWPRPHRRRQSAGRGRVRRGATRKPHAGDTGNPIADRVLGANDQHACLTSCRRVHNGFPRGDVPPVSAVTNFVAIAVHADEQCENRCGFVATHFVAVIRARREIKTVSAEYRDYQKRFHFRTNSQRIIFVGFLSRVWRSILGVRNAGGTDAVLRQELSRPQAS
jgi:hypothetical protein